MAKVVLTNEKKMLPLYNTLAKCKVSSAVQRICWGSTSLQNSRKYMKSDVWDNLFQRRTTGIFTED